MRTGFVGEKVVINGGAFVLPVLHEITPVNMNVMRIEVSRRQAQAPDHPGPHARRRRRRLLRPRRLDARGGEPSPPQTLGRRTLEPDERARAASRAGSPRRSAPSPPR